ncbi:thiosulfate reductase cytochrome b subunit [Microbacterium endophyticum]|uniref:Thiosulfate reductase cytochrome b subunit n=1 Tax=Microbacterium endophyticum TaxID=1526412 RepID=A0A7W4YNK7_9MICO|nr:cytochrome b/b6 domain-containing protein [Microbacterium endophyticum]MBB2975791.1 thiosulfate reductase cytochrome b subunit [Microbacterium endophyticum]NIK36274.1 thiosulfate reductase cytochrome b subunit [Microbacterium endophyticum]
MAKDLRAVRRGLPREPGGEAWPPASVEQSEAVVDEVAVKSSAGADASAEVPDSLPGAAAPAVTASVSAVPVRRGLPRTPGGEPWPDVVVDVVESAAPVETVARVETAAPEAPAAPEESVAASVLTPVRDVSVPLPFTPTVFPGRAALAPRPKPKPEAKRYGPFTRLQWIGAVVVGGGALLFAAAMLVLATRWLVSLEPLRDFLQTYPGEYPLPETAPVGLPAWAGWQHFFNVFFMVLIIRTGLQVRSEKRPAAFWSPRGNKKRRISLTLWYHQALDILWLANGAIFVILLIVTGQWMRIVPTSWDVFPNAISAGLQYASLDWPTENGWVNYNSLQQLAYFTTVFVAAPLAAITGVRMSGIWPKNAARLNRLYPVEWARAVHFPVMLYFVFFIIVHVALVFATGALRNLNHMYAAQDVVNWTGFWIFAASMLVIAAGWVASRPLVLAPIARLFGTVKGR